MGKFECLKQPSLGKYFDAYRPGGNLLKPAANSQVFLSTYAKILPVPEKVKNHGTGGFRCGTAEIENEVECETIEVNVFFAAE